MAGTTTKRARTMPPNSDMGDVLEGYNDLIDNLETIRDASFKVFSYKVEDLGAGVDIAARACFVAPVAITILDSVKVIPEAASAGVDAGNTLVLTLRNITEGVDIATVTRAAGGDLVANTPVALTLTGANADIAANDVLGIVVTQGATADAGTFLFQFAYIPQTIDAAADITAAKVGNADGTAY